MATKRIQLRGISHAPSDRATEDGGCSESLNVYLDQNEIAPAIEPTEVTADFRLPKNEDWTILYEHKNSNYDNLIVLTSKGEVVSYDDGQKEIIMRLEEDEVVTSTTSLGNTLYIVTNVSTYYVLFKDRKYTLLGSRVPFPIIQISASPMAEFVYKETIKHIKRYDSNFPSTNAYNVGDDVSCYDMVTIDEQPVITVSTTEHTTESSFPPAPEELIQKLDDYINGVHTAYKAFCHPLLVKYSLKLTTGGRVNSVPILVGAGYPSPYYAKVKHYQTLPIYTSSNPQSRKEVHCDFALEPYYLKMELVKPIDFSLWKDVVDSIEVYISNDISYRHELRAWRVEEVRQLKGEELDLTGYGSSVYDLGNEYLCGIDVKDNTYEKDILSTSTFCRLCKLPIEDLDYITGAPLILKPSVKVDDSKFFLDLPYVMSNDERATYEYQLDMSADYRVHSEIIPNGKVSAFNDRLILSAPTEIMPSNYGLLTSNMTFADDYKSSNSIYSLLKPNIQLAAYQVTYIIDAGQKELAVVKDEGSVKAINPLNGKEEGYLVPVYTNKAGIQAKATTDTIFFYPDSRCVYVDIKVFAPVKDYYVPKRDIRLKMIPHPFLDCAYCYYGAGVNLYDAPSIEGFKDNHEENRVVHHPDYIYMSDFNDPFTFPLAARFKLSGNLIGVASVTTALSQGQFGQFPLYAFTDNGIWALSLNAEGNISNANPVSREIALSDSQIAQIDRAIIFITAKDVRLISGSDSSILTLNMNGLQDNLSDDVVAYIKDEEYSNLFKILANQPSFNEFIRNSETAYDYLGNRLLLFRKGCNYAYTYMLLTQTWHMINLPGDYVKSINSYPECLIQLRKKVSVPLSLLRLGVPSDFDEEKIKEIDDILSERYPNYNLYFDAQLCAIVFKGSNATNEELKEDVYDYLSNDYNVDWHENVEFVEVSSLYDFSTILNPQDYTETNKGKKGIIVTRTIDLDEPRVRKIIKHLKIVGNFNRKDAQWLLLGSNDGIHFGRLSGLRTASYKFFKLIIFTNLAPAERISYVEVEYEERLFNKLR